MNGASVPISGADKGRMASARSTKCHYHTVVTTTPRSSYKQLSLPYDANDLNHYSTKYITIL